MVHPAAGIARSPGVVMDVRVGESLMIGDVRVTIEHKTGQIARLRVAADKSIAIRRHPGSSPLASFPAEGSLVAL